MTNPAAAERQAYVEAAQQAGPQGPTLCDPWTVADLSAHIVLRESRPDLAAGIMIGPLAGRLETAQTELAATDFEALVDRVQSGPPVWNPARLGVIDDAINLIEFFVHTEDIRRPAGLAPRVLAPQIEAALTAALRRGGRLMFRKSPVGVRLQPTGADPIAVHPPTDRGQVVVSGDVGELVLVAYGRIRAAQVETEGSPEAIAALSTASLGFGG